MTTLAESPYSGAESPQGEAPIKAVTVYTDRALVTRRGRVTLEPGEQPPSTGTAQVVLPNLPLRLVPESVRAAGRGTVPARILGVDVSKTFHAAPAHLDVARLEAQIKPLEEEDRALADKEAAINARLEFLKGLGAAAQEQMAKGLAFGKATLTDGTELANFLGQGLEAASAERREVARRRREIAKELEALRRQLKQLQIPKREPQAQRGAGNGGRPGPRQPARGGQGQGRGDEAGAGRAH